MIVSYKIPDFESMTNSQLQYYLSKNIEIADSLQKQTPTTICFHKITGTLVVLSKLINIMSDRGIIDVDKINNEIELDKILKTNGITT